MIYLLCNTLSILEGAVGITNGVKWVEVILELVFGIACQRTYFLVSIVWKTLRAYPI